MTHALILAVNPLDARSLLNAFGTLGVAVILFAETGLLIGFFLPGDSLLLTAGLLCSTSVRSTLHLSLPWVLPAATAGAIARSQQLFARYGYAKAIVLARFVPVVRTVLNPLAGVIGVPARVFTTWQVVGGLAWSLGVTLAGYYLGKHVAHIDRYLLPIVAVIVVVSLIPLALELLRSRRETRS